MSSSSMEMSKPLHIAIFPWLAMGHIIPFFNLSKYLAQKGHKISFISTPRNLKKLSKLPPNLSYLVNLISLDLPHVDPLPDYAESAMDIPPIQSQFLKKAFDLLQPQLTSFLQSTKPDWIIYDYASHWLPSIAANLGISRGYFSLFTAAFLGLLGPPSVLLGREETSRSKPEDFTVVPNWVPFDTNVKYRLSEAIRAFESAGGNESGTPDAIRFGVSIEENDVVVIRSSDEFEPDWFNLLNKLYQKPVFPIGFLPPLIEENSEEDDNWAGIKNWLDKQRVDSVVYVALGSEAVLSREQLTELALGLEQSELPFFFVIRNPKWMNQQHEIEILPNGFIERISGRGMVHVGWAPQVKILNHNSVGGFLTHCGWNSVIEGLGFGRVLILLPVLNDQALNARLLEEKQLGIEIKWSERDRSFSRDSVAESARLAMVGAEGEPARVNAKKIRDLFGNAGTNNLHIDAVARYLEEANIKSNSIK